MSTTIPGFNPSNDPRVDRIKHLGEKLLMEFKELQKDPTVDGRCMSLALTNVEQGCMWGVKALFVGKKSD